MTRSLVTPIACLFCLVLGCGGPAKKPTENVTGRVTFEGKPVTEGEVHFYADDGAAASVKLDSSGNFTIEQLPIGKYKVSVTPPQITEVPAEDPSKMAPPKKYENIPDGYQSEVTTDLVAEVKEGKENKFTFDMVRGGGQSSNPMEQAP